MFTVHDVRMTGCPALATTETAEGAYALAECLGFREHALALPVVGETTFRECFDRGVELARAAARHVDQLALGLL